LKANSFMAPKPRVILAEAGTGTACLARAMLRPGDRSAAEVCFAHGCASLGTQVGEWAAAEAQEPHRRADAETLSRARLSMC
jgi:hypothetical protein